MLRRTPPACLASSTSEPMAGSLPETPSRIVGANWKGPWPGHVLSNDGGCARQAGSMMYAAATASDEQNCAEVAQPCLLLGRSCCAAIAATRSGRQVLTSYRAPPQASDSHLRRIMLQKSSSHFAEVMTAGAVDCYLACLLQLLCNHNSYPRDLEFPLYMQRLPGLLLCRPTQQTSNSACSHQAID